MKGAASWDRDHSYPPVKSQNVRLLDVFLLGPAMMVAGGMAYKHGYRGAGAVTFIGGFATIVYNAINYGRIQEREELSKQLNIPLANMPGQSIPGYQGQPTLGESAWR